MFKSLFPCFDLLSLFLKCPKSVVFSGQKVPYETSSVLILRSVIILKVARSFPGQNSAFLQLPP